MAIETYAQNRERRDTRVVVLLNTIEVDQIDRWGAAAKMQSRNMAIRHLIAKGLEAELRKERASSL